MLPLPGQPARSSSAASSRFVFLPGEEEEGRWMRAVVLAYLPRRCSPFVSRESRSSLASPRAISGCRASEDYRGSERMRAYFYKRVALEMSSAARAVR